MYGDDDEYILDACYALCYDDDNSNNLDAPEATLESTNEALVGDWALVRVTGGFAGVDINYSIAESPETLTFRDSAPSEVDTKTDTTLVTGLYDVVDVTSSNDTTFFSFGPVPVTNEFFYLTGRPMYLIGSDRLESEIICCDQHEFYFDKL